MLSSEIVKLLGCQEEDVINLKHEFHYKTTVKVEYHDVYYVFNDKDAEELIKTYRTRQAQKAKDAEVAAVEKEKKFKDYLITAQKEHPLVKDERCFKLNWWPETIPSALNEGDDD